MKLEYEKMSRRKFLATSAAVTGTTLMSNIPHAKAMENVSNIPYTGKKKRVALIGLGNRGSDTWGRDVANKYLNYMEFVGICDTNKGRLDTWQKYVGIQCPSFLDFEKMMRETKPDVLIVCTPDYTHNDIIVRGMELGANIITEKPMTIDEKRVQSIIDAEKRTGKVCRVTFNYRYSPHRVKLWELLRSGVIGELTSADFHWYLDIEHGADYFRRWHRKVENSGSLLVHKACHHFDLLNWWIDSDPEVVFAMGALDHYGKNGTFRAANCRNCNFTEKCPYYFDIMKDDFLKLIYVDNEKYDGYLRDGCVFRNDVNIFDKMAATIRYCNGVQVSYSLTSYSPYEGYRIAFNGTKGRIDAWIQEKRRTTDHDYDEIVLFKNFKSREYIQVPLITTGHGGGDVLMQDQIFLPDMPDPYKQCAGVRDGALSCLIGIAARNSIASKQPVYIKDLTSIVPQEKKIYKRVL